MALATTATRHGGGKLRPRRPSPSIRPLRRAPEPTDPPYSSAVSLRAEPLSFPSRLRALGHSSVAAELRPPLTSSPPSLQPLELPPECTIVLRTSPRARCLPQLALSCPLVVACVSPELRRPQPSSPPSTPATPGPETTTIRRAIAPALRRAKGRTERCSIDETRATPVRLRRVLGRRRRNSGDCRRGTLN